MMKDVKNKVAESTSIAPAVISATTKGTAIDLQGFDSALVILSVGTLTDGTHTPSVQESDTTTDGDFSDVAAADLIGSLSALVSATDQRVSYIGSKRYIRVVNTVTGSPSTGCALAAVVTKGFAHYEPVS